MSIQRGIPKFELESGNVVQAEFWEFEKDEMCAGLYGQQSPIQYVDRLLADIDRAKYRREAKKAQLTCDKEILDRPITQEELVKKNGVKKRVVRRGRRFFWRKQFPIFNPFAFKKPGTNEPLYHWCQSEVELETEDIDHYIASLRRLAAFLQTMSLQERIESDPEFAREMENGEWDC